MENKYGVLFHDDILIHRNYFEEMCHLIGVQVKYCPPSRFKQYSNQGELHDFMADWMNMYCIFQEYPDQITMKKLGWIAELGTSSSLIHLPYDTPELQRGAYLQVPCGLDGSDRRLFRVTRLSNIMIYPASISCEIVPEWENTVSPAQADNTYKNSNYNFLKDFDEEEYNNRKEEVISSNGY